MSGKVFVDTWGWLAVGHRKDPFHKEVKEYYQTLRADKFNFFTSDYVLDETITLVLDGKFIKRQSILWKVFFKRQKKGI